jgi:hypothetical protein
VPGLAERMAALVCVDLDRRVELEDSGEQDQEKSGSLDDVLQVLEKERTRIQEKGGDSVAWLELEELGIDDDMLVTLDLPAKFPVRFYLMCMLLLANLYIGKGGYVLDIVLSMKRKEKILMLILPCILYSGVIRFVRFPVLDILCLIF